MEYWPQYTMAALIALKFGGNMVMCLKEKETAQIVGSMFGTSFYWGLFLWVLYCGGFWK